MLLGALMAVAGLAAVSAVLLGLGSGAGPAGAGGAGSPPALPSEGVRAGRPAPGFSLPGLRHQGLPVVFAGGAGSPTVLTFFASWCTECRKDLGVLASAQRRLGHQVRFVGVDVADSRGAAVGLVDSVALGYRVGVDADRAVSGGRYRLVGLPSAVFVDARGRLVGTVLGPITRSQVDAWVQRAEGA